MKKGYKILLVEDLVSDAELIEHELLNGGIEFAIERVDNREQFLNALLHFIPDIIICDQSLPQFNAFSAMSILKQRKSEIPFLLTTGTLSDEEAVEYLKWGVYDYILKTNLKRLPFIVKNALSQNIEFAQEGNQPPPAEKKKVIIGGVSIIPRIFFN